jgi:hypothetical protein
MIIYWGDKFSAKVYTRNNAWINEKNVISFDSGSKSKYIIIKSSVEKISKDIWYLTEDFFYQTQNEIKYFTKGGILEYDTILDWGYNTVKNRSALTKKKYGNFASKHDKVNDWFKKTSNLNVDIEPIEIYKKFDIFTTSDLLITQRKLIFDAKSDFEKKQLVDLLQKSINLISYNSDPMHTIMSYIMVDLLLLDRDKLYRTLDRELFKIKSMKCFMDDNNIKYEWYDTSTLNPLWDRHLPKDWNKMIFDLKDPLTNIVKTKSEEYIRSRGITDLRTV